MLCYCCGECREDANSIICMYCDKNCHSFSDDWCSKNESSTYRSNLNSVELEYLSEDDDRWQSEAS